MDSKSAPDAQLAAELKCRIREIPDFPRPGILFYDVSTLFRDPAALARATAAVAEPFRGDGIDVVAGIEARGFVLGAAVALDLARGLAMIRKLGKLPGDTVGESYELEYGNAHIEMHRDAVQPGQRVLIVDDLLATGGTAAAAGRLVERLGGTVAAYAFLVELAFLDGRKRLAGREVFSLLHYA
jgi:adenine phosphoribosyltransferase